jgi:secreted Zn-dependent insulinase-like peptidase
MKLKNKDQIITCLIDMLSQNDERSSSHYLTHKGWIEALKWVLGLTEEEKNVFKDSEIISAIDLAIGDDGTRSKEVIAILEGERNE